MRTLELPADSRSDEITLQIVKCKRCGFAAVAVYEESRRGSLGEEAVDHRGYTIGASDLKALKKKISQCPSPRSATCACPIHQQLGRRDQSGRWNGLASFDLGQRFLMQNR